MLRKEEQMCGIATVAIGRRARKQIPYPKLRALIREIFVEIEPRGRDASGIAVINEGGQNPHIVYKKPLRSSRLVERPCFQEVLETVDEHTNFVMLHARATTVGNNAHNPDNHPIIIPDCVGIHNGTLYNHEQLFDRHSEDFDRIGNVDSEVIFQLFKHYTMAGLESERALQNTVAELHGAFTGAVVDLQNPHRMVMFKYDRSLCVITIPHYDILITVSEAIFFDRAIKTLGYRNKVGPSQFVHDGTGMIFDLNAGDRITKNIHDFVLPVNRASRVRYDRSAYFHSIA